MPTIKVELRRVSVVSSRPFDEIIQRLMETIGRPDVAAFHNAITTATTLADLDKVVQGAIGSFVSERPDGVHLSFDSLASLLAPYGNEPALAVARDLDAKVESLLETAAGTGATR